MIRTPTTRCSRRWRRRCGRRRSAGSSACGPTSTTSPSSRRWSAHSTPSRQNCSGGRDGHRDAQHDFAGGKPPATYIREGMNNGRANLRHSALVADHPGDRHRHRGLHTALAVPALDQGGGVRAHRLPRREGGGERRRLRDPGAARDHAGQHERHAHRGAARKRGGADHQKPHARRPDRRVLRARRREPRSWSPPPRRRSAAARCSPKAFASCWKASSRRRCAPSPRR